MSELDLGFVRHALEVARKHGFAEVELSLGDDSFSATLAPASARSGSARSQGGAAASATAADSELPVIKATLVGYYQEAPAALRVGQQVRKGDVVAVIEALGLANDVEAQVAGEVVEVLVESGQAVQYGQSLAIVRPL